MRIGIGLVGILGLVITFLFQRFDVAHIMAADIQKAAAFIINRSIRFLLNDLFALLLIFALFPYRSYIRFAIAVQLGGVLFILIPYFVLKIYYPSYNGPLINYIHRLIINPVLLLLLIPAFYYQSVRSSTK